jgi:NADH-quinone oxidoreductase subunit L
VLASVHDKIHAIGHEIEHGSGHTTKEHATGEQEAIANPLAELSEGKLAQLVRAHRIYQWLYYASIFTTFLTAFYTFRAFSLTFYGPLRVPHQAGHHAHESPAVMVLPLIVLAVCAAGVGLLLTDLLSNWGANGLIDFLGHTPSLAAGIIAQTHVPARFHLDVAGWSTVAALTGVCLAMFFYMGEPSEARVLRRVFNLEGTERATDPQWVIQLQRVGWIAAVIRFLREAGLGWLVTAIGYLLGLISLILSLPLILGAFVTPYRLSRDKFYFDEIYSTLVVWPLRILSAVCYWIDRWVVDGLVNLTGRIPAAVGTLMRPMQMGLVQFYALAMVLGTLILVAARIIWAAG